MKEAKFKELVSLSKGFKIFLIVLSIVAVAGIIGTYALMSWANGRVETANLTFNGIDKGNKEVKANENAYSARVHFERLDVLLRSKVIAYIDIKSILWAQGIETDKISSVKSQNRHLKFISTQNLQALNTQNLGEMKFTMDFSPLLKTIVKYYLIILLVVYLGLILYKILGANFTINKMLEFLKQNSLPQAIWQSYKNTNPLYRHTFWIVFIACNIVFGFDTVQFLWGRESWGATFDTMGGNWMVAQGRYTQNAIVPYLTQDLVLPILNNVLAFIALSFASILLCVYLNITRKLWIWAIVGFVLTLSPFTLSRMYFTYQVVGLFIAVAIGILGFILAKKAGEYTLNATAQYVGGGGVILTHSLLANPLTHTKN